MFDSASWPFADLLTLSERMYFGIDPAHFYSALGWGNTALTAGLITYWSAAVGIAAMRRAPEKEPGRDHGRLTHNLPA